jgi:hypothetical protein
MLQDSFGNISIRQSDFKLADQFHDRHIDHQWNKCKSVNVTIFRGFKRQSGGAVRCVSAGFPAQASLRTGRDFKAGPELRRREAGP